MCLISYLVLYVHSLVKSCLWCQSCWCELSSYLYISFLMIHFFPIWFQWTETFQLFWICVCHFLNYGQNIMSLFAKATVSMFIVKTWVFLFFPLTHKVLYKWNFIFKWYCKILVASVNILIDNINLCDRLELFIF